MKIKTVLFYYVILAPCCLLSQRGDSTLKIHLINGVSYKYQGDSVNGQREGQWKLFNYFGKIEEEGEYVKGRRVGVWMFYNDGILIETGEYVNGLREGEWKITPYKGAEGFGSYEKGNKIGKWILVVNDIIVEESNYNKYGKHGVQKKFYSTGELLSKVCYKNDAVIGEMKSYFKSGMLKEYCLYKNGIPISDYKGYYEDGNISWSLTYDSLGVKIASKKWDEKGNLIEVNKLKGEIVIETKKYNTEGVLIFHERNEE